MMPCIMCHITPLLWVFLREEVDVPIYVEHESVRLPADLSIAGPVGLFRCRRCRRCRRWLWRLVCRRCRMCRRVHLMLLLECRAWQGISLRKTGLHSFHRDIVDLGVV